MTAAQAAYYLANFPSLSQQVYNRRDDIINQYRQEAFAGGNRQSGHSDPTAKKAILLADGLAVEDILYNVRLWIDTQLSPRDRPLLISVWRSRDYGWSYVGRELNTEVWRCQARWHTITIQMAAYLNQSAGPACAQPGTACVGILTRA